MNRSKVLLLALLSLLTLGSAVSAQQVECVEETVVQGTMVQVGRTQQAALQNCVMSILDLGDVIVSNPLSEPWCYWYIRFDGKPTYEPTRTGGWRCSLPFRIIVAYERGFVENGD